MYIIGKNPVLELLKSDPQKVEKVFIAKKTHIPEPLLDLLGNAAFPVVHIEREKLDRMAGNKNHQGIIAVVREVEFTNPVDLLNELIEKRGVLVALDEVQDPQNLGNILRSAEALGAVGVVVPALRSSGFTESAVKASAGAVFHLKIGTVTNLRNFLSKAKEMGVWIYSLEVGGISLYDATYNFPMILIAGGEDKGVGKSILSISDVVVSIPMFGKINSLNVASSVAIALSWISRVRRKENG